MKKEKKKVIELIDVIKDIKKIYEENNDSIPVDKAEQVNQLFSEVPIIEKRNKNLGRITLFLLAILISSLSTVIYMYNIEIDLHEKIDLQKDQIIQHLESNNKILNLYVRGEQSKDSTRKDSTNNKLTITTINGKIQTYFDLENRIDSLDSLCLYREYDIKRLKIKLDFIHDVYGISINDKGNDITLIAPKLDSALRLYPHYKNKLRYDKEKDAWFIDVP